MGNINYDLEIEKMYHPENFKAETNYDYEPEDFSNSDIREEVENE